ncbi:uncharacterized protein V6R79_015868 [Siganus canaliculatus]
MASLAAFFEAPSVAFLKTCKKDELSRIADHFCITVPERVHKDELRDVIVSSLFDQGVLQQREKEPSTSDSFCVEVGVKPCRFSADEDKHGIKLAVAANQNMICSILFMLHPMKCVHEIEWMKQEECERRGLRVKPIMHLSEFGHLQASCYHIALPWPGPQVVVTNLRNRPLVASTLGSLRDCVLSLYHNLVTGSRDFPPIPFDGHYLFEQTAQPFGALETLENSTPSDRVLEPPALMVPTTDPRSAGPTLLVPAHPERVEPVALLDRRSCVRRVVAGGRTLTRVISPVYRSDRSELVNLWRVSDYTAKGLLVMSVFCRFTSESMEFVETQTQNGKKRALEEASSSCSSEAPAGKRLRL